MAPWDRKKYYKLAKGFYGKNKNARRVMIPRLEKALCYAYRDRKVRRRLARKNWILSINAAVREHNLNYSNLIFGLNRSNIQIDRKILAELAINEPYSFKAVVDEIKLNPRVKTEDVEEVSFNEALARGLIIDGRVKETPAPVLEVPFLDYRGADKMTPKEREELKRL